MLIDGLPRDTIELLEAAAPIDQAQSQWCEQLARWRDEAEGRCEANIRQTQEEEAEAEAVEQEVVRASAAAQPANPRDSAVSNVTELFDPTTRAAMRGCAALQHHTAHELDHLAQSLSRAPCTSSHSPGSS